MNLSGPSPLWTGLEFVLGDAGSLHSSFRDCACSGRDTLVCPYSICKKSADDAYQSVKQTLLCLVESIV